MRRLRLSKRRGFTLAELLVATTLLAIVMSGVYTLFHGSLRAWRIGDAGYEMSRDGRFAARLIQRDILAVPPRASHLFEGTEDTLEFVAVVPPMDVEYGTEPRLMWVAYRLAADRERTGRTLIREEAPVTGPLPELRRGVVTGTIIRDGDSRFVVAEGIDAFELSYRWTPPYNREARPSEIELFVTGETHGGLPRVVDVALDFSEREDAVGELQIRTLVHPRISAGAMPDAVRSAWQRSRVGGR